MIRKLLRGPPTTAKNNQFLFCFQFCTPNLILTILTLMMIINDFRISHTFLFT